MEVRVFNNQIEKALRLLKRKLSQDGIMRELKNRMAYEKPGEKRKRKQKEAKRRKYKIQTW
ncbi:MAG: 30S ribosomal protein S21 [Nitrospinota bacterium]|jgi:small subunit ribosomal protein S21|nr:MAG: 30S ribosomal protein S21 [Nitrospinae bacterium RIFCSPHIGHO2_02_39_11]OGV99740.1 MAG: 30S ribosomal protein S21 [Nitrospinae bacterium RIFCSPHIGHO2_12_FULL_39_42]OGW00979.1 MAG: 30S ribosomal protein S21 [Nitrospinae bacterium RIFCSPHIGHO2_02_FULL_39_82]OGW06296.1 MAG: 30S ribosomal protein S21 [Nitrospinae bacterium RIFCSPLOWO2_02_39_17]OGW07198.1 MAG: 30S ribosomal protein S21 [Nitrospinae bacterium RIFCSPLOWO2_02_FULL_39_110]OGW07486.1 MAG: 30S ribosomal protein S21 [Nitrospinae ba